MNEGIFNFIKSVSTLLICFSFAVVEAEKSYLKRFRVLNWTFPSSAIKRSCGCWHYVSAIWFSLVSLWRRWWKTAKRAQFLYFRAQGCPGNLCFANGLPRNRLTVNHLQKTMEISQQCVKKGNGAGLVEICAKRFRKLLHFQYCKASKCTPPLGSIWTILGAYCLSLMTSLATVLRYLWAKSSCTSNLTWDWWHHNWRKRFRGREVQKGELQIEKI